MSQFYHFILCFIAIMVMELVTMVNCQIDTNAWIDAHATFYVDTQLGACGYDTFKQGYGQQTTALSTALFNNGASCGICYEIICTNSKFCKSKAGTIKVTATNFCPPSTGPEAWCNPPWKHFDLTQPMFETIAEYRAGIVPVKYRRINCARRGGVKFIINGNPNFLLVLVFNVGGVGDVTGMKIKSSSSNWVQMSRNWGMNWQVNDDLWVHRSLSFQVTTSDGKVRMFDNLVPENWQFGQSFEGNFNF